MILSKTVAVEVTKNKMRYWMEKEYNNLHPGTIILVSIEDVPLFYRGVSVNCKCDECGNIKVLNWRNVSTKKTHICYDCKQKRSCAIMNPRKYPIGENHHNWNPNRRICRDFQRYSCKVRKLTEENYTKYKEEINPSNYPRTKCGVQNGYQLDHKVSLKWGFTHGLNPKIVAAKDNLQMLPWKANLLKGE